MTAPAVVEVDFPGLAARPIEEDDAPALHALERAIAAADHPNWAWTEEELRDDLGHSWVDRERDTLVVLDGATPVAYGSAVLAPVRETGVRVRLEGGVHPEWRGRGIGRRLLAWQEARGLQLLGGCTEQLPGWLAVDADERATASQRLLHRAGFDVVRYFNELQRDLAAPIPELAPPAGIRFERLTADRVEAVRQAKNEAFRDHWGSQPTPEEQWETYLGSSTTRQDLSFVALDGERVVGLLISEVNPEEWELQGARTSYIGLVGVVRDWRRRGIAPALLAAALAAYREEGLEKTSLGVDSENPTGALSLYTRMGFELTGRELAYRKTF